MTSLPTDTDRDPADSRVGRREANQELFKLKGRLRELGVTIPGGSRIGRYFSVLRSDFEGSGTERSASLDLVRATIEIRQIELIVSQRELIFPRQTFDTKLRETFSGSARPEHDDTNSHARNTQFELYVAALLAAGGTQVELAEPDIRFELWGKVVGVAAKRVKSKTKIRRKISSARKQVLREHDSGAIDLGAFAIDVSALSIEPDGVLSFESVDSARTWLASRHSEMEGDLVSALEEHQNAAPPIVGAVFVSTIPTLVPSLDSLLNEAVISSFSIDHETRHVLTQMRSIVLAGQEKSRQAQ